MKAHQLPAPTTLSAKRVTKGRLAANALTVVLMLACSTGSFSSAFGGPKFDHYRPPLEIQRSLVLSLKRPVGDTGLTTVRLVSIKSDWSIVVTIACTGEFITLRPGQAVMEVPYLPGSLKYESFDQESKRITLVETLHPI